MPSRRRSSSSRKKSAATRIQKRVRSNQTQRRQQKQQKQQKLQRLQEEIETLRIQIQKLRQELPDSRDPNITLQEALTLDTRAGENEDAITRVAREVRDLFNTYRSQSDVRDNTYILLEKMENTSDDLWAQAMYNNNDAAKIVRVIRDRLRGQSRRKSRRKSRPKSR